MKLNAAAAIALLAPSLLWSSDSRTAAARLLAEVKAATGGAHWDRIRTWHERGSFSAGELSGTHDAWLDFPRLRSFSDDRGTNPALGAIRDASGWNGKVSWSADQSGDVYIADSEEARSSSIGAVYQSTFAFLFPKRLRAELEAKKPQTVDGTIFDIVLVKPRETDPFELWIDRANHRVLRIVQITGVDKTTSLFSDFREVGGIVVPFKMVETGAMAAGPKPSWQLSSVAINEAVPKGLFDPPPAKFSDVTFPPGRDSVTVEFRFKGSEIFLPVLLNGREEQKFVFDIGSSNSIDAKKAQALGLKSAIVGTGYGGGTGSSVQGLVRIDRLEIGGLRFDNQLVDTTELSSGTDDPEGLIGYEVARRTVVIIDYEKHRITFLKPNAFRPPRRAVAVRFRFASRSEVLVPGSVDGIRGDFQIDTGAGNSLMINRPFAQRHGLIAKHRAVHEVSVSGIGGQAKTVLFRPDQFAIASIRPPLPVGQIYLSESGGGVEEHVAGNIGNDILKRFTLTLDYAHRMLYFEPNAHFNEPDVFSDGWGGLKVSRKQTPGPLEVIEIDAGGPAAQLGIAIGDLLVAINDASLEKYSEEQINSFLNAVPGTMLRLKMQRGNASREVELRTRPLI